MSEQICDHCGVDTAIQPQRESGCNHVHYPEACEICIKMIQDKCNHMFSTRCSKCNKIEDSVETLKSLITKQDVILREYKKTIDTIKLACPKWQIAELEEILSPRQNGFDIHD